MELKLNVHNVSDFRQIEAHTAEPLVPDAIRLEDEIAVPKLKKYNRQVVIKFRQNLFKLRRNITFCDVQTH
jgi:hypothetical protein